MAARRRECRGRVCGIGPVIFVTVGTQLPFPRLIDAMDDLVPVLDEEVVAQVGPGCRKWQHIKVYEGLCPDAFENLFKQARVVVAHAGIGSILSAQRLKKPLIIFPRRHSLGEHRNDHQLATARQIEQLPGVYVAWSSDDLLSLLSKPSLAPATEATSDSRKALVACLKQFISRSSSP